MSDPAQSLASTPQPARGRLRSRLAWLGRSLLRVEIANPASAVALLAGAVAVQSLTRLPSAWIDLLVAAAGIVIALRPAPLRWLGVALLGAAWTLFRADASLSQRLPLALEGQDIVVVGTVSGLPRADEESTRFDLRLDRANASDGSAIALQGTARLSWYDTAPPVAPCSIWQLRVRLKRPRGLVDPGAFDFERYALAEGISATGYVREDAGNRDLGRRLFCADALRGRISDGIAQTLGPGASADVLRAFAFGDQHAMDEHEWEVARATGIPHLIAISGLHIALFAGFGVLIVRLLWRLAPRLTLRWPAPLIEAVASIVFATGYATIAGLGLPTRRALVMIGVLLAANLARRARAPQQGLAFAVIVLLALDPLCVLSAGFWLSFVGVAWLMFCLGGPEAQRRWWRELVTAQGVASIGLLPLTIWFFGQSSLVGPIANLVAVPWICFVVLPVGVAGALLQMIVPVLGAALLQVAGHALATLWTLLEHMATWPGALWYFPEPSAAALALAMVGAAWLLLPRGVPARALGLALFLPLLVPARSVPAEGEFDALMLDVGQGLSVLVRTREHALVYDAGARFPSGFDLGEASVVPALHALGVDAVDRLVISHGDNDHAGGARAVATAFKDVSVTSGEPQRLALAAQQCRAGESWTWNGVLFRIVHPRDALPPHANDRSCVLEVRSGDAALVLTGDVSSAVEGDITQALGTSAPHTVLQVPHHGSKTSSSPALLAALHPELALVSTGYRNRFHHPNAGVVERYRRAGIELRDTARTGFIALRFAPEALPRVLELGRRDRHPYWREE
jgi:competence protein ComEC